MMRLIFEIICAVDRQKQSLLISKTFLRYSCYHPHPHPQTREAKEKIPISSFFLWTTRYVYQKFKKKH
jgi:hypothetical protein